MCHRPWPGSGNTKNAPATGHGGSKLVGRERDKLKPRAFSMFVFMFREVQQQFRPMVLPKSVLAGRDRGWGNVPRKDGEG